MADTPLTDQQHADIRARHEAATSGTWYLQPHHGPTFVASESAGYEHGIGDLDFGVGDQADADREFVLNAHGDMEQLLAEVDRLRAELTAAGAQIHRIAAQSVAEDDRLRAERDQARADGMREAAAMLRRYCPDHGGLDEAFIGCHCPAAVEIERDANALAARADAPDAPSTPH